METEVSIKQSINFNVYMYKGFVIFLVKDLGNAKFELFELSF